MYADKITGSIQRALEETDRRRDKQSAYNDKHGIIPKGIRKAVTDIMEGAYSEGKGRGKKWAKVAEEPNPYYGVPASVLWKKISKLEEQMYQHARDLEFEEAARLRDEIKRIRSSGLEIPDQKAV